MWFGKKSARARLAAGPTVCHLCLAMFMAEVTPRRRGGQGR
ncbi:MAG TPA: hypothetical protein DEF41_04515 [Desulfovibrio sp.]|uniref:Uncharacterized protein n=1 Tax=Nitratidesulfovibrio vulgaris (strain ATCC 29579 / DSM 644 / CCUG 34227 / NCIMB 8303 / VKM B-1760 / Hildenborough) TaxID=882 RepID=Q72B42_NITV2|nr:hypothetical protein DVU_1796 [Nitratidesulfovibrio vulgaris str. Hildenborough]HBW15399.1 hypothetical protein [Desulfovibrio sp.]